jgi:hypothetical protein
MCVPHIEGHNKLFGSFVNSKRESRPLVNIRLICIAFAALNVKSTGDFQVRQDALEFVHCKVGDRRRWLRRPTCPIAASVAWGNMTMVT